MINQNKLIINTGGTTTYEADNLNLEGSESYAKVQGLSNVNNAKETIEGDRSNMRFLLDSSFYLGPKGLKSGIIGEIAPNITRMSRTQALDSIINAAFIWCK